MQTLTEAEIDAVVQEQKGWALAEGKLVRDWEFADFVAAMKFVNEVAALAEAAQHHPDIDIRYNKVRLGLVSHDAGGITKRDAEMVRTLNAHFPLKKD